MEPQNMAGPRQTARFSHGCDDTSLAFTNLHSFDALQNNQQFISTNHDGANPQGGLVLSGNMLFGTTAGGGVNGSGTIFCVTTNGTNFTTLHHFAAVVGLHPCWDNNQQ